MAQHANDRVQHKNAKDTYIELPMETRKQLTFADYTKLIGLFNKFLVQKLLDGVTVWLPAKMGRMAILGKFPEDSATKEGKKNRAIDYKLSREYGKVIYHSNEHSEGAIYKLKWFDSGFKIRRSNCYKFEAAFGVRRELAKRIKSGQEYLIENR